MSPETANATRTLACSKTYLKGSNEILNWQFHARGEVQLKNKKEYCFQGSIDFDISTLNLNFDNFEMSTSRQCIVTINPAEKSN